jgi:hypothetical protein
VTERCARDPDPGLAARVAAWLFPSLYPDPPVGQACTGPCAGHGHQAAKPEPEPEADL